MGPVIKVCKLPCSSVSKEYASSAGNPNLIPKLHRSSGEGNGRPLQYSCLDRDSMDRGAWRAIELQESDMT